MEARAAGVLVAKARAPVAVVRALVVMEARALVVMARALAAAVKEHGL